MLLPPLGEGWDGGAEIARKTPVDSSLALAILGVADLDDPCVNPHPNLPPKAGRSKTGTLKKHKF